MFWKLSLVYGLKMPKRSAIQIKLDETLDLLNIESEKNFILSNNNKVLTDCIQYLERENGIYISESTEHFTEIEKLKSIIFFFLCINY
jgi:hypothetical protein